MSYKIIFTKQAAKDYQNILASPYKSKLLRLLLVLENDPMQPPFEKLTDKTDTFSRRINLQHRLVYQIIEESRTIKVLRMWTHYGDN